MINNSNKKMRFITVIILAVAVLNFIIPNIFINTAQAATSTLVANQALFAASGGLLGSTGSTNGALKCGVLDIGACFKNALNGFLDLIAAGVAYISAAFVWLAAFLVNFSFDMNLRLGTGGVIGAGWSITNGLANLGFVLAIIVIAFATILRFPGYGWKPALLKLIAAALLVNFSLLIAFVFIDFSNVLTGYFLKISTQNKVEIAGSLANAFRIQSMREAPTSTTVASIGEDVVVGLATIAFQVAFNIIIILTFLALAVMMGVRYIALSILLILAPLAWLFWILPFTQKWWQEWWSAFIKWVIFAPTVSLFIYIAIQTVNTMGTTTQEAAKDAALGGDQPVFIKDVLGKIADMAVVTGILLGGLIAANKTGIAGSSMFYKAGQKMAKAAQGYTGRTAARGASYPLRTETGRKLTEKLQQAGSSSNRFVRAITRPIRSAGSGIASTRLATEKYNMKAAKASLAGLSHEELARRLDSSSGPKKAYILSTLAKAKKMSLLPKTSRRDFENDKKRYSLLYGQHETFQKTKTVKGKTSSGETIEFDLPDDEEKPATKPETKSNLVDEFGRPIIK